MIPSAELNALVHAIYVAEGSNHTRHPYGVMIKCSNPLAVCERTCEHIAARHHIAHVDRYFVHVLCDVYCPISSDPMGHKNWSKNVIRILHL